MVNDSTQKTNGHFSNQITEHEKVTTYGHVTFESQALAWDRHKNMAGFVFCSTNKL
jgi:hypothetical protein